MDAKKVRRREFLVTAGCFVAGAACAGCLGGGGDDDPATGSGPQAVSPTTRCPFGLVNDRYPGRCVRYVDADGNGLCDLSESSS